MTDVTLSTSSSGPVPVPVVDDAGWRGLADTLEPTLLPVALYDWTDGCERAQGTAFMKRLVDIAGGLIIAAVTAPLCIACAVAVRLTSPGPVFYTQLRVGRGGRLFTMVKFRSMVDHAEAGTGPTWARAGDARATGIGRVMRRYRLDELPQLWNVLAGEMSLVGPRPERPELNAALHTRLPRYGHRLLVKPGITGWAQVRHSYTDSIESARTKLGYDLFYIAHLSLWLDLRIAFETVRVVCSGFGSR
jgi:lipopolysaccharide/colanic/teichoic acid biosynthesis glycosyltransferase